MSEQSEATKANEIHTEAPESAASPTPTERPPLPTAGDEDRYLELFAARQASHLGALAAEAEFLEARAAELGAQANAHVEKPDPLLTRHRICKEADYEAAKAAAVRTRLELARFLRVDLVTQ